MPTTKPVHDAGALATIIPFRPRRSQIAPHPSFHPQEPLPPAATDDPPSRPHLVLQQLSLFAESPIR